jgi:hypothetical protein
MEPLGRGLPVDDGDVVGEVPVQCLRRALGRRAALGVEAHDRLAGRDVRDAVGDLAAVRFGRVRRRRFHGVDQGVGVCTATRG